MALLRRAIAATVAQREGDTREKKGQLEATKLDGVRGMPEAPSVNEHLEPHEREAEHESAGFHEGQKVWIVASDGSQRPAIYVGMAETSSWLGGRRAPTSCSPMTGPAARSPSS